MPVPFYRRSHGVTLRKTEMPFMITDPFIKRGMHALMQWHQPLCMRYLGPTWRTHWKEQLHDGVVRRARLQLLVLHQALKRHHAARCNG